MTTNTDDIRQILAEVIATQKETAQQIREVSRQQQETERRQQETAKQIKELSLQQEKTDQQLKEVSQEIKEVSREIKEVSLQQEKTDQQLKEVSREIKEVSLQQKNTDQQLKEVSLQQKKTDQQLKELGKQIGGLGAKFGSFTEGLAFPSMQIILKEQLGMEIISPSVRASKEGKDLEIDVLAYSNGTLNTAYIVEVKSHAREESIGQMKDILQRFREFFPEHKDKKLYGILAVVDLGKELHKKILKEGFYVARIHGEVFELDVPQDFRPKTY